MTQNDHDDNHDGDVNDDHYDAPVTCDATTMRRRRIRCFHIFPKNWLSYCDGDDDGEVG